MKKCVYCGGTVSEADQICPNCEEATAPILKKKPMPGGPVFKSTRQILTTEE